MTKTFHLAYDHIISVENLLGAWREFVRGKRHKRDVQQFELKLMDNILSLHCDLKNKTYRHDSYQFFRIHDPKPRDIYKATVRDRLVHHAIHRVLFWFCHQIFIADSFSCRLGKGTHKALNCFRSFAYRASHNNTKTLWVLKCDVRKFFASIDQTILLSILRARIINQDILWLLRQVIGSFHSTRAGVGLPLGNLTSQLFVNIYLNDFDQFVKRQLKAKNYLRYSDDFVILSENKNWLRGLIPPINNFLLSKLKLTLHPQKVSINTLASGVDFLGWVHFTDHWVLRTSVKKRMLKRLNGDPSMSSLFSYLGLLKHGNTHKIQKLLCYNLTHEIH